MTDNMIAWDKDADGIVTLTMDDPNQGANTMNELYFSSMTATVARLEAERDDIAGVVLTSAKKTFFAGGDLKNMMKTGPADAQAIMDQLTSAKAALRRLETLGKPVVAAINGSALGGGLELALACHHRIAADIKGVQIGLPEVTLGLLPAGGGITRTVRMLGIQNALTQVLLQGTKYSPAAAQSVGLVSAIVNSVDELVPAAKAWIKANPESSVQPWDVKGYKLPGGSPADPAFASNLTAFSANLRKQLKGANMPAPQAILAAAVEGSQVDFDNASLIESRYFVHLLTGPVAKNMIQAFFFDLQSINNGGSRPDGIDKRDIKKIGVLGAGMMGAGIAYVSAKAGYEVVLKDVTVEAAQRGKDYSAKREAQLIGRGTTTESKSQVVLDRITPTADVNDFNGVDFVIEAVFENTELKHKVFAEIEDIVAPDALLGSNTSTLPITGLAAGVKRQEDFIGIHFFSPVDKMPLVEIIKGEKTSDEALARAFDYVLAIRKTPIVVNDSRGFFTSRVIGTFGNEAIAMLLEGIDPQTIEQAGLQAGYPAAPLQLADELNLKLMQKVAHESLEAARSGDTTMGSEPHPALQVVDYMLAQGRPGRLEHAGFYEYDEQGTRLALWPGLREHFSTTADPRAPLQDLIDRLLFIEAIETQKCFDEGVLTASADANIGSIFGIGYPAWTGGVHQFIVGYPGGGQAAFVKRADELAAAYGRRFEVPTSLRV
ncbi:3-hydroxyacyl-CoA dehydrogenase NAD-binding domain-containing protein [Mycobacterium sp. SM3041]|uniref:3-hydroxyacyl-CoA dehydrogenase NAD-binding domain-containing protein n=1 Tax=Mycobacterium sp. SM3041 TaxID=3114291 RepID=UPI003204C790